MGRREREEGLRRGFGRRERGLLVKGLFGLGIREREEEKVVVAAMDD